MTDPITHNMGQFFLNQAVMAKETQAAAEKTGDKAELRKACEGFESVFVNYLMQQMRKTIPQNGLIGGGQAEKIYTGMLDSEVAKTVSAQRGIGLAKIMYEQMSVENSSREIKK